MLDKQWDRGRWLVDTLVCIIRNNTLGCGSRFELERSLPACVLAKGLLLYLKSAILASRLCPFSVLAPLHIAPCRCLTPLVLRCFSPGHSCYVVFGSILGHEIHIKDARTSIELEPRTDLTVLRCPPFLLPSTLYHPFRHRHAQSRAFILGRHRRSLSPPFRGILHVAIKLATLGQHRQARRTNPPGRETRAIS